MLPRLSSTPIVTLCYRTITDNGIEPGNEVPVAQLDFLQGLPGLTRLRLEHVYTLHLLPLLYVTRAELEQVVPHVCLVNAPQRREKYIGLEHIMACIRNQPRFETVKRWVFHVDDQRKAEGHEALWCDAGWQVWVHNCRENGGQVFVTSSEKVDEMSGTLWHWRVA